MIYLGIFSDGGSERIVEWARVWISWVMIYE